MTRHATDNLNSAVERARLATSEILRLATDLARARRRLLFDGLDPGPAPTLAALDPLCERFDIEDESHTLKLKDSASREDQRRLQRVASMAALMAIEKAPPVAKARHQLRLCLDPTRSATATFGGQPCGIDELVEALAELAAARLAQARTRGRASYRALIAEVAGMPLEEVARLEREEGESLKRGAAAELVAQVPGIDFAYEDFPIKLNMRGVGEFLSRIDLSPVWDGLATECASGIAGAEALALGDDDVRIFTPETDGTFDARAYMRALGAAIHDIVRVESAFAWAFEEAAPLRLAIAGFMERYLERAGWLIAHGGLDYDIALLVAERMRLLAMRATLERRALSRFEGAFEALIAAGHVEAATNASVIEAMKSAGITVGDDPLPALRQTIFTLLSRPALVTWIGGIVADNLHAELVVGARAGVDNPAVGPFLLGLLAREDSDPWEVRLEVLRGKPLSGAPSWHAAPPI